MAAKKKSMPKAKATAKPAKKARASAKAAPRAAATASNKAISQKQSKSQIYAEIAEMTNISKNDVKGVIAAIRNMIERHVKPKGSGEIVIPDLGIKVRRISKKATKARMGRNPFTGEEIQIAAKPARKSVKVSAMKSLKALIED
ncbi:MAG: HU family DNA-binding protein [Candidatus Berkiella sp.]